MTETTKTYLRRRRAEERVIQALSRLALLAGSLWLLSLWLITR